MKIEKARKAVSFVWRLMLTCVAMAVVIKAGDILLREDGFIILIEKMTLLSANSVMTGYETEEQIITFTSVPSTEVSFATSTTTTTTTTTQSTTAAERTSAAVTEATTVPTGENIKKVSEEQLLKGTVSYGKINVKNTNKNHSINIKDMLSKKPDCKIETDGSYQVLIIHTHTTECYAAEDRSWYDTKTEWRSTDEDSNITSVGAIIAEELNASGIKTLHVTVKHDYPKYNGAYTRAKDTISEYLEKYPSIKMVIDVHRDSITRNDGTKVKPTAIINGKKAAQVMIISGCDDEGDLNFPDWEYNLRMAVRLQKQISEDWPGLARPLYFAPFRYNMHMTHNSLLIEIGTEVNTLDEAQYTAMLLSESLSSVLSEYISEEE